MQDARNNFGARVKKIRSHQLQMTLREVAEAISVTPAYLSSIELGVKSISEDKLSELLLFLAPHCPSDEIEKLRGIARDGFREVHIPISGTDFEKRDLALTFAREFSALGSEDTHQLRQLLKLIETQRESLKDVQLCTRQGEGMKSSTGHDKKSGRSRKGSAMS